MTMNCERRLAAQSHLLAAATSRTDHPASEESRTQRRETTQTEATRWHHAKQFASNLHRDLRKI